MSDSPPLPTPTHAIPDLPPRAETTHKGQVGRVAIIAGSRGMSGAAVLCGLGALRGGAGLVRVFTPASVHPIIASTEPCLMVTPLGPEMKDGTLAPKMIFTEENRNWGDVWAVGPGCGPPSTGFDGLVSILMRLAPAIALDADALNLIAGCQAANDLVWPQRERRPTVLTPHPGEMARLRAASGMPERKGDDDETRLRSAHEYAVYSGATVVLKGHRTVVCTPDRAYINTTGNPGMATGGMGDVLTGLIAALLGQGLDTFDAARLAVHVHGAAADLCARTIGPIGYLARDVADHIPAALTQVIAAPIGFTNRNS